MAKANISYVSLTASQSEAYSVARKLDKYAEHLNSQVYNKLNNYGGYSSDILQAKSKINMKVNDLYSRAEAYRTYAQNIKDLEYICFSVDNAVKGDVSTLTGTFKTNNDIRDSKIQNGINLLLTSMGNSTVTGRWLGDKKDQFNSIKEYLKQRLEDWWDYEGGVELVKGIAIGVLEVVIAVCTVVLTGGSALVVFAGILGGLIALGSAFTNIYNEKKAYDLAQNGDPATGRRRSDINSIQDYLRSSFIYEDHGEDLSKKTYNKWLDVGAATIDIASIVCSAVTFVDGMGTLMKNAYKWTTGSMADVKNLSLKNILTKDNFVAFRTKLGSTMSNGKTEVKEAVRMKDVAWLQRKSIEFGDDFLNNLSNGYTFDIFAENKDVKEFVKSGAKLTRNYASITKMLIADGINLKNIVGSIGFETIVLKNTSIANVTTYNGGNTGALSYNIESIKLTDITGKFGDIGKITSSCGDLFSKLGGNSTVSIRIPDISIPDISGINAINIQTV